jgi:hypothetical protein
MTTLIRRDELNKMLSEWKSGVFGKNSPQKIAGRGTVLMYNNGPDIHAGLPLAVTGRMFPSISMDDAITEYLTYGVQLAGAYPADDDPDQIVAITAEPIYSGRVGRVWLGGVIGASVNVSDESHKYVDCDSGGLFSADSGPFRLVAHIDSFAFILPVSGSGGHLVGSTQSALSGSSATTDVNVEGKSYECNCPILTGNGKISAGKTVVISRNMQSGDWQIIAAECE